MCATGGSCSVFAPGHAVHLIQTRLAAATPSEWIDAIVEDADERSGVVALRALEDDARIEVWNGSGAAEALLAGTPVALHGRYHLLAIDARRFNVARLPATGE